MSDFVHLHVHTQYSLLDGMNKADKLFEKVSELGMNSVAVTDHGVLYGMPEFWKASKDFGIKTIFGCEMYLAPGDMSVRKEVDGIRYYHLLLLAKNKVGYQNLIKLVTKSHTHGMYYKPRIDLKLLKKYSEGLICTSACLAGPLSRHITRGENEKAEWWLKQLHGTFKDDFYLEIQRNGIRCEDQIDQQTVDELPKNEVEQQLETIKLQIKVNKQLYKFSDQYKIPVIASTDAHYLNKDDKDAQKVLFCIRDGRLLTDPNGLNGYVDTYIKSPEEMKEIFSDIPEVLEETLKIDEKIEAISLKPDRVQPQFWNLPKGSTSKEELKRQVFEGAKEKYGEKIPEEVQKQLEYELMVIEKMGYNDYFLVVGDLMQFARKSEIVVGVRGSAAGSLASYCLGITNVDPLKWGLVFERFLNLERMSPPDIDMDIQDDRREELIDYAREKYGQTSVAGIITFGKLATKAAIRDVARVLDIDLALADKLSKKVIVLFGKPYSFEKMMEEDEEFKKIVENNKDLEHLRQIVGKIEGLNRHTGVHAAGYLITPGPVDDYMAYQKDRRDENLLVTQMDGNWIDKLDYMKFDFLGLRTLTIIKDAILYAKERHGVKVDLEQINVNPDEKPEVYDQKAMDVFRKGETIGVFQFESPPMQKYLKELKPQTMADICFMAAAYRPGPMQYIPDYIEIRNGRKKVQYIIPELEPILRSTLSYPVYQEQLLQICMKLGGFTLGEGDVIRNALKKKQLHILKQKEGDFLDYFVENYDYPREKGEEIWSQLEPFASYGFNKAHASSYAAVAYWCAYLKGNYPLEFMTALMHADLENTERVVIDMKECERMGFELLPPNINKSFVYFKPEGDNGIRFGMGAIKNAGIKVCEAIVEERNKNGEFEHLDDLVTRVGTKNLSKRAIECLIKVGAMDQFGDRAGLLEIIPEVFQKAAKDQKAKEIGQQGLFNMMAEQDGTSSTVETPIPSTVELTTDRERMEWEKELIGIYVTTHPLKNFRWTNLYPEFTDLTKKADFEQDYRVKIIGMFSMVKHVTTKKDGKRMAIVTIDDGNDTVSGVIFPRQFQKFNDINLIEDGRPFIISGTINYREKELGIIIEGIEPANSLLRPKKLKIDICGVTDKEALAKIKEAVTTEEEGEEVEIVYGSKSQKQTLTKFFNIDDSSTIESIKPFMVLD